MRGLFLRTERHDSDPLPTPDSVRGLRENAEHATPRATAVPALSETYNKLHVDESLREERRDVSIIKIKIISKAGGAPFRGRRVS